ncbi:carbamoyltransferase HypF [Prochlorothrix hollandica]|uniref:carbamoyltransferase HypF n=1 Tax=Prochlorothrix hollandica TaxID=1223 RepID=UPI0006266C3B
MGYARGSGPFVRPTPSQDPSVQRLKITINGLVQGVGFRPFVYGLARELDLGGWICNTSQGVMIEVQGYPRQLAQFLQRLSQDKPPHSRLDRLTTQVFEPVSLPEPFTIRPSQGTADPSAFVLPDLATCSPCLQDLWDPHNRRHRYPFTNCTHCGPRYSIIHNLPYDRPRTTLAQFSLCPQCQGEYEDPGDRRFHAQPNACAQCGPRLEFWRSGDEQPQAMAEEALQRAIDHLRQGQIIAVKGLGGFQLMVAAHQEEAVQRLRQRKQRPHKPLAVMFPDLPILEQYCDVSPAEAHLLQSAAAPIVLLTRRRDSPTLDPNRASNRAGNLAPSLAPDNPNLGVMLPTTPLHHLLLRDYGLPLVATSGNVSGDPLCWQTADALVCLGSIADGFLSHDRPIARPVDDSIVRVVAGEPLVLRRARGYAPLPLTVTSTGFNPPTTALLALGGHFKNTLALYHQGQVILSPHLGNLDSLRSRDRVQETLETLQRLYNFQPQALACDAHPDYGSSQMAQSLARILAPDPAQPLPLFPVQHHYAHVRAVMAEQQIPGPVLGVVWDGLGYGLDGQLWGGEFLRVIPGAAAPGFERVAHWRSFPLPGGDRTAREPRRSALGLLFSLGLVSRDRPTLPPTLAPYFSPAELHLLLQTLDRHLYCPATTSMGRLFDGVSALLGLCPPVTSFEGQGAMAVEFAAQRSDTESTYPWGIDRPDQGPWILDWEPLVRSLLADLAQGVAVETMARCFHNSLIQSMGCVAQRVGLETVVLGGGCFQNRLLLETAIPALRSEGFRTHWSQQFPPNDGGLALGQVAAVLPWLTN